MIEEQRIQEDEYSFPYHYIPSSSSGFTQTFNWTWGINYISALEYVLGKIAGFGIDSVCDIGCGDGRFVRELHKKFSNLEVLGIDYSQRAIMIAKALNPKLRFEEADILSEGYNFKERFQLLTMIEVFEHIPLDRAMDFARKISSLQVKGDKLIITVPHKNKPLNKKHFQHFDKQSILGYFNDGYIVKDLVYFDRKCKMKRIIDTLLTNRLFILNNKLIKKLIYSFYIKYCFIASDINCNRMYLELERM